jgi:creatinine amidohydrolase
MKTIILALLLALAQPAPATKGVRLERLASGDARVALNADAVVVIPLGAGLQPHGAHLGVGTDLVLAEHVAHRVMEATAVSVAPPIAYHFSTATELSASATLSPETAHDMTLELVRTLSRSGPRRFYIVNTSATPGRALSAVAAALAREGILLRFSEFATQMGAHSAETETSMMLHIDAPSVTLERAPGDASAASAARGKVFLDSLVERIVREVESLKRATPPDPQPAQAATPPPMPQDSVEPRRPSGCTAGDERSIVDVATRFSVYWTMGEVDRIAELWSSEGDLVHPDGVVERGREIIRANRRDQFRRKEYRGSKHSVRFGVIRCVSPEVAVADGKWELTGVYDAAGNLMPRGDGPATVVLKRHGGAWLFEAYRYSVTIAQGGAKPPTLLKKPGYPDK